jgi:hypothetical protein
MKSKNIGNLLFDIILSIHGEINLWLSVINSLTKGIFIVIKYFLHTIGLSDINHEKQETIINKKKK